MKYPLLSILILAQLWVFGQLPQKQLNEWDSLRLRTKAELNRYENLLREELCYTDTLKFDGSVTIIYYSFNKRKLQKISKGYDEHGCIVYLYHEYFNKAGLLEYEWAYKKCCSKAEDDTEICLEHVTDYQRLEYDDKGRVTKRIFHVTTPMTYREIFTYTPDGAKQIKREKIRETQFWD